MNTQDINCTKRYSPVRFNTVSIETNIGGKSHFQCFKNNQSEQITNQNKVITLKFKQTELRQSQSHWPCGIIRCASNELQH